jgi:hypothetical protein
MQIFFYASNSIPVESLATSPEAICFVTLKSW